GTGGSRGARTVGEDRPVPAPPAPPEPMAGLGGAGRPSPPVLAPRDPPVPAPPPLPVPAPGPPVAAPEGPPGTVTTEARPVDEGVKEEAGKGKKRETAARTLSRFAVVYDVNRPHGRIGLAWAAVTVAAVFGGKLSLAAWFGLTAFVGASQTAAARRALEERPPPWLAALTAVGPPVAALYGGMNMVGAVAAGLGAAVLARTLVPNAAIARDLSLALLIGIAAGTAAGSVVVTRELGVNPTFFLLACTAIYDVGAYLIGTGAGADWEGPVAGMVGIMPVAILGSVLLVPPFPGSGPILLGALAVVLTPLGPLVATALVGGRELDAPGLRRLDSLILLGPMWAFAATRLLG
ncbi:MAG TPA: phosphatidate cytidylyltransferase, partial [Acidimicrobiales bacterium]|nr:phosphatidate cytidylyltransferase [Acidimicrobiales bacterium]